MTVIEHPAVPGSNCGAEVVVRHNGEPRIATCTEHGLGHYDPELDVSWPAGPGRLLTEADAVPVNPGRLTPAELRDADPAELTAWQATWATYFRAHPEVAASYRYSTNRDVSDQYDEDDHPANRRDEPTEEEATALWGPIDVDEAGPEETR